ncbi:MAG TPA: VOC family protein [Oculatellaceae cyanobacterium]|jgi:catechol 2,3-dioxygenase-like lactoylglutathione lyase family enzyme
MPAALNHTIVKSKNSEAAAKFWTDILGLPAPGRLAHFQVVEMANGVSMDFMETDEDVTPQHYAFLVSEQEFDEIFDRIRARGIPYWADPQASRQGEINRRDGGRGLYFEDPDGHFLEILTRPYGSGGG